MTNPVINKYGKYWYNSDEQLHRDDGPAIEYNTGSKYWYINGIKHRDNGPAVEHKDGTKYWYINGTKHRYFAPACEHADGRKEWYIKGKHITNEVIQWILDNNFPEYEKWDDFIKVMFKLTFG